MQSGSAKAHCEIYHNLSLRSVWRPRRSCGRDATRQTAKLLGNFRGFGRVADAWLGRVDWLSQWLATCVAGDTIGL